MIVPDPPEGLVVEQDRPPDWIRDIIERVRAGDGQLDDAVRLADEVERLRARLEEIESRVQQIRGGLKPYARPVEVVDFAMGTAATERLRPRPPAHTD